MKSVQKILKYQEKIIEVCSATIDYVKIDDLAIDCLAGKSGRNENFIHAYEDLISDGRLGLCGNSVRFIQ